ncbi:MAG: hypothetical protein NT074_03670 [Methanomicrobiales archaeon]|nr:hypothetical protein [Methanomicrobiales archaeon]
MCQHPQREKIDGDIISGVSLRNIAEQCSVSTTALHRHKSGGHIPQSLTLAHEAKEVAHANTLLQQVKDLVKKACGLTDRAEHAGDLRTALSGVREVRGCLELLARVTGELQSNTTVNIAIVKNPEWIALRTKIISALQPHPAARSAVLQAIGEES